MKKKVLFLAHSNNDVDWFLPLAVGLKKENGLEPVLFFLRSVEESQISAAHRSLIEDSGIAHPCFFDALGCPFIARFLLGISRACVKRSGLVPVEELAEKKDIRRLLFHLVYIVTDRLFGKFPGYFFPVEEMRGFMKKEGVSMVVVDLQSIRKKRPFKNLKSFATSAIISYCKESGIPVLMMLHGGTVLSKPGTDRNDRFFYPDPLLNAKKDDHLYADIFTFNNEADKLRLFPLIGDGTETRVLGSIRYDYGWNRRISDLSADILGGKIVKKRPVILYLVSLFHRGDLSLEKRMQEDVVSLLGRFPEAELWIKYHPRTPWLFRSEKEFRIPSPERFREFRGDIDTSVLFKYSDVVISTGSSAVSQAILLGKKVVLYDLWRKEIGFDGETIYDELPYVLRASDREGLYESCRVALGRGKVTEDEIRPFYEKSISAGLSLSESIIPRYVELVKKYVK